MKGLEYIKKICDVIAKDPDIEFHLADDLATLSVGSVRTIKVGKTTVKYEVIAIDTDPMENTSAQHTDVSKIHSETNQGND